MNILTCIRSKKGEVVSNTTVTLLVTMMIFALAISFIPMLNDIITLNSMAHEIARVIEIKGEFGSAAQTELSRLKNISRLTPDMSISASFLGGSNKLQLGSEFTLTLKDSCSFGIGSLIKVDIPITAKAVGRSEMYWRN